MKIEEIEIVMDPPTDNTDLKNLVEQQGEKISQLKTAMEFLVGKLVRMNPPRNDPPPPPPLEEEWFDDAESSRVVIPRERGEKEKQEFDEIKGKKWKS